MLPKPFLSPNTYFFFKDDIHWLMLSAQIWLAQWKGGRKELGDGGRIHNQNPPPANTPHLLLLALSPTARCSLTMQDIWDRELISFCVWKGNNCHYVKDTVILTLNTFSVERAARSWLFSFEAGTVFYSVLRQHPEERDHEQNSKIHHK